MAEEKEATYDPGSERFYDDSFIGKIVKNEDKDPKPETEAEED